MFRKLDKSYGNIVGVKLTGKLTDEDFKNFVPEIEKIIASEGKIRLLMVMDYPQEFELKAAWDDLVFWIKHIRDIERLAIVGQKEWEKWIKLPEELFLKVKVKYYSEPHLQKAWDWVSSP